MKSGTEVEGSLVALSKELGAERIPCSVAWTSATLTKAWQGAVEKEMDHISAATFQQAETWLCRLHTYGPEAESRALMGKVWLSSPKGSAICDFLRC